MSKNWFDLLAASILGLIITFLLVHFLNKHINTKPAAVNINMYQFAVVNFDSPKEDKSNISPKWSFAPEMAAQRLVDNNDKLITFFDKISLVIFRLWPSNFCNFSK